MARGRRPKEDQTLLLQMTFRLSQELRDRLDKAADGRAIGDEIRERLELSFDLENPERMRIRAEITRLREELKNA